jgi:hypothetical protein
VLLANRLWYSGDELIAWIQTAGRAAAVRQRMEV